MHSFCVDVHASISNEGFFTKSCRCEFVRFKYLTLASDSLEGVLFRELIASCVTVLLLKAEAVIAISVLIIQTMW